MRNERIDGLLVAGLYGFCSLFTYPLTVNLECLAATCACAWDKLPIVVATVRAGAARNCNACTP